MKLSIAALHAEWPALNALLDDALAQPPAARAAWLDALQGANAAQRAALAAILTDAAAVETEEFLGALPRFGAPHEAAATAEAGIEALAPGAEIGPYRLLQALGRGGMGEVWLAERSDAQPRRKVALKLPHLSWEPGLAARLERERDILASLEHPHIARLYDAGIDRHGRPYLALEYVDGTPIDRYVAEHALPLRERLELLLQVCAAVAHAHAHLVVHRDLKPSNILVDAQGHAHLLDFGIAKLVDPDPGSGDAQATLTISRALTPAYASPEQIRGDPIGTASDIYSMGVVAYELLAGARPYRMKSGLGAVALAEAIMRAHPLPASKATTTETLRRQLRGDLDAILARALAKTSDERYATVDALADDLQRHLRGEPVRARAATPLYVAGRWVRRHKAETGVVLALALAAGAGAYAQVLVAVALGAGTVAALWQRNQARRQAGIARAALARGEQVKDFIASIFTQAVPRAGRGGAVAAADLLRAAARRVETDLVAQPAIAAELGALIGASFNELGEMQAALEWLPKAVELATRELGSTHRLALQSRYRLVEAANWIGDIALSESLLPALIRDLRAALPPEPRLLALALEEHGFVHAKRAREAESIAALNESLDVATRHFGEGSDNALLARVALSNHLIHFARKAEALEAIAPALALARAAHGEHRPHRVLLVVERGQADAMASNQRPRDAVPLLRQVLADQRALDIEETPRVREAMTFLGKALMLSGRLGEAAALFEQAAALHEQLTGGMNHEAAGAQTWCGRVCVMAGDGAGALRHLARADEIAATLGAEGEVQTRNRAAIRTLAAALAGRNADVLATTDALVAEAPPHSGSIALRLLHARAMALRQSGDAAAGVATAQLALTATIAGDCPAIEHGLALAEAARCHLAAGAPDEAERQWRQALSVWNAGQVDTPELLPNVPVEFPTLPHSGSG
ncbi:MAG: serine/threonine-protein kinase [Caldimonas sp.]